MVNVSWNALAVNIELNSQIKIKYVIGMILFAKLATLINQNNVKGANIYLTFLQKPNQENVQLNVLQAKHFHLKLNSHQFLVINLAKVVLSTIVMFVSIRFIVSNAKLVMFTQQIRIFVWINVMMALFLILSNVFHVLINVKNAILVAIA